MHFGPCRLWIPNGSLTCSPIHHDRHASVTICDCLSIWYAIWALKCLQGKFDTHGYYYFPKLSHPSTCFSHAEYHYCVTVYRSDMQSDLQSACTENLIPTGFIIFPFLAIHRHASVIQNTTIVWLSIDLMCNLNNKVFTNLALMSNDLMCNLNNKKFTNLALTGFTFSKIHLQSSNLIVQTWILNTAVHTDVFACLFKGKKHLMGFKKNSPMIIMR